MKLNWGTGIAIFIIGFMGFILFMVVKAFNTNTDLHAEDYYQQELDFQQKIDASRLGKTFVGSIKIDQSEHFISVTYPDTIADNFTEGRLLFYRPDNARFDKEFAMSSNSEGVQHIDRSKLVSGGYTVQLEWKMNRKLHYIEQELIIN